MSEVASLPKSVVVFYHDTQITRYAQLATGSIIIFDHLITFDEEVTLVWSSAWSITKVLFLTTRYYVLTAMIFDNYAFFVPTLTDSVGHQFLRWQGWTGLFVGMMTQGTLQIRIYAIHLLDKKILALMLVCFTASSATSAWVLGRALSSFTASAIPVSEGLFCVATTWSPHFYTFWIPTLCFESLLCFLALLRGLRMLKFAGFSFYQNRQELMGVLIRDSVLYFLTVGATYFICIIFLALAAPAFWELPVGFSVAFPSILANRMVLNIRRANAKTALFPDIGSLPAS
ncbi:hypothetical protein GALMADRAFT_273672 [Galerina marginata CBS 339.88]|uniref:DUF6533 domain-containing protein n=1 Tax=Galerina marginata (strain CBS 339.88) TaxID=685588 RepID=A0A067SHN0_GALM3|nr:hypothetical protein GALMADRAFT_273672 [Galerina marginata CBS 339.88]